MHCYLIRDSLPFISSCEVVNTRLKSPSLLLQLRNTRVKSPSLLLQLRNRPFSQARILEILRRVRLGAERVRSGCGALPHDLSR